MRGARPAPSSPHERAAGLRCGRPRAHVRGVQHRGTALRLGSRRVGAAAARGPVSRVAWAAPDSAGLAVRVAQRCAPRCRAGEASGSRAGGHSGSSFSRGRSSKACAKRSKSPVLEGRRASRSRAGRGAGLRTARLLAARTARMAGLIPVASAVLVRLAWLRDRLAGRHLCILLDDHPPAERATLAMFLAQMGTTSARRHVLLRFTRTEAPRPGARQIDSMGIAAMTSMVFVDDDNGPSHEELFDAARGAAGRPGLFLERLRAAHLGEPAARIAVVHESSPAYVFGTPAPAASLARRRPGAARRAGAGRPARGARQARVGHPPVGPRLARARRARRARAGRRLRRAACLDLSRSRPERSCDRAVRAACERSPATARPESRAVVGIGVVWTDQRRFREAEASLRGACAAAGLLGDAGLTSRASRALARCLYWQARYDEAAVELMTLATPSSSDAGTVEAWALLARSRAALGDIRAALAAAGEAVAVPPGSGSQGSLPQPSAAWPVVQLLVGDEEQARLWSERSLRARLVRAPAARGTSRTVPARLRRPLRLRVVRPMGARRGGWDIFDRRWRAVRCRRCCDRTSRSAARVRTPAVATSRSSPSDRALLELEIMLEMAHAAPDESAALEAVCQHALERLRAASVQIVSGPGHKAPSHVRSPAPAGPGRATRHSSPV